MNLFPKNFFIYHKNRYLQIEQRDFNRLGGLCLQTQLEDNELMGQEDVLSVDSFSQLLKVAD